ncbi:MAG TPA: hypothetical protein VKQ71_16340 [Acidimicrobiales bacterium]|nr:hypothetical protein [Acidimicrobiales bacterium]
MNGPRGSDTAQISTAVDSHPERGVRNSQPEGIGRVASLTGMCAWNNLGRNIVFADRAFRPLAVLDETSFPDDDELSQYDLDVHAILEIEAAGLVIALNHLGAVRIFRASDIRRSGPARSLRPIRTLDFVADVERAVVVGDRLVGSRPRSQRATGILVSEPLSAAGPRRRLDVVVQLEPCGEVTALGAWPVAGDDWIAVGGEGRVSVRAVVDGTVRPPRWETGVDFRPAGFAWDGNLLWAAGSDLGADGIDDYDWEQVRGGGFVGLDPLDGDVVVTGRFPPDLAWGNGGVAVVLVAGALCGIGRSGELYLFSTRDGAGVGVTAPLAHHSLGIAHAVVVGDHVLCGWNRDGYRLHSFPAATLATSRTA